MRDTRELSTFVNLTDEKAPLYWALLHALLDAKVHFVLRVRPGELLDALGAGGFPSFGPSPHPSVSWWSPTLARRDRA